MDNADDREANSAGGAPSSVFLTEVAPFASAHANARPYEHDPEKGFTMDIMMMMDMEKVSALRKEFQVKENGLSISEFVFVMMKFVQSSPLNEENARLRNLSEQQLVANLCELFAQIDINGDGSMEWEEFTSFIVDTGLTVKSHQPNSIQHYHHVPWEDASKHSTFIDHIYYFPGNDLLALIENCSPLLKIYNVNCELVRSIKSPEGFVQCAEHIPKFDQFVLASSDLQFRFYDDTTLRLMKSCHTPTSQNCLKWYPETTTLFSAGVSGIVYAWDAERMEEKHHMGGEARGKVLARSHDDIVLDLLSLPTLESLASASMDRTIRLWDVHTGKHKQQLDGHTKGVRALAYSPEYRFLVSAGFDFDALVWNPYVDQLILRLHGHNNSLCGVEIIPDTPQIVTADVDGVFKVWDIRNFACMQTFSAENVGDVKKIVSINSQKRIVAAGKKLTKFDYEKLENPELTDDHPVFAALYNPTSLSFITAAGKDVKIWDARLGKLIRVYRGLSTTDLTSLCLDFRERKFIVGDHAGNIHVFDYLNGSHMKSFAYPEIENRAHFSEVSRVCYCDEHMSVISTSWDCCIDIHDESDSDRGVLLRRMSGGHAADITALCFSFPLSLIASASSDNSLQIWDYEFGRLEGTCIGHVSGILALQFLDPFPILVSSDGMGNICFWGMRPCQQFKWKCIYRFRNQRSAFVAAVASSSGAVGPGGGGGGGIASVTCLTTHTTPSPYDPSSFGSYLVIAGDDKGVMSVWNVLPLLQKLEDEFRIRKLEKPVECANPQRNLRVNASGMVRKFHNGPEWAAFQQRDPLTSFFFLNGTPLFVEPLVPCVQQWKAHGDVVYSIQMITEPQSVITSSFDRRVKIWNLSGECLGILMQGELELSAHKRPWSFTVDYNARERKKENASSQVIEDVHKLIDEDKSGASRNSRNSARRWAKCTAATAAAASSSSSSSGVAIGASLSANQEAEADVNVLEEITRGFTLPPILSVGGSVHSSNSNVPELGSLRKTPRRKPVTAASAGKSQFVSPRQLRVINRAGMSSPR